MDLQLGAQVLVVRERVVKALWCVVWFFVGALWSLSFISFIGVITLPIAIVVTALLCLRPGPRAGSVAALSGLAVPFLYVAWLNRSGPGTTCRTFAGGGSECVEHMSPLPWLGIGVVLLLTGIVASIVRNRSAMREG
jgi:hypothetical protein